MLLAPSRPSIHRSFVAAFVACALIGNGLAQDAGNSGAVPPEHEAKLIATLTNATLKGRWAGIKEGQLGPNKEDSYFIASVTKLGGDKWQVNARLSYGGKELSIPIPVQVKWAGDTPVLVLNNVSMGTNRSYSARVMIYEKTYSGWWTAPDHGGLLNGVITNN